MTDNVLIDECRKAFDKWEKSEEAECLDNENLAPVEQAALVWRSAWEARQKEIDRLHKEIVRYRASLNLIAHPQAYEKGALDFEEAKKIAIQVLRIDKIGAGK